VLIRGMSDWENIETAPTGKEVLIADFRGVVSAGQKDRWGDWLMIGNDYAEPAEYLTHWMPLPDGPQTPEEEAAEAKASLWGNLKWAFAIALVGIFPYLLMWSAEYVRTN
jgi:hypothetical protein